MESRKENKIILNLILIVIAIILLALCVNFFLFRKRLKSYTTGHFEIRDGVETYVESGQVVVNALVQVGDKLYYVDDKGHKIKDGWAKIDNDGNYGYFGSLGDLVKDRIREVDGKLYYFDKDGVLYTDKTNKNIIKIEGEEYIANEKGELRHAGQPETTAKIVTPTTKPVTIAPTTQVVPTTSIQDAQPQIPTTTVAAVVSTNPPFSNTTNAPNVAPNAGPNATTAAVGGPGAPGVVNIAPAETTVAQVTQVAGEVAIVGTENIVDSIDGEDYPCTVTLLKPIMTGKDAQETTLLNNAINGVMGDLLDEVSKEADGSVVFPRTITFTSATLGNIKDKTIIIYLNGTIGAKSIRYRITYDRNEGTAEIVKSST